MLKSTGWIPDLPDPRDYGPSHKNLETVLTKRGLREEIVHPPTPLPARIDLRASFPPVFDALGGN